MLKFILIIAPFLLIGLTALPHLIIKRHDAKLDGEAIDEYRDTLMTAIDREPTFEERWDANDDEFMKKWSSFCSRDLQAEEDRIWQRCATEMATTLERFETDLRWTFAHYACHIAGVETTVEVTALHLYMKAQGVDFKVLREHIDPLDDTHVWTSEMERELAEMLAVGVAELQDEEVRV